MPKTIYTKRNPLTRHELKPYWYSLKFIQEVRKAVKQKYPSLGYIRIFTEAQNDGVCRSKFWGTKGVNVYKAANYINKHFDVKASVHNGDLVIKK